MTFIRLALTLTGSDIPLLSMGHFGHRARRVTRRFVVHVGILYQIVSRERERDAYTRTLTRNFFVAPSYGETGSRPTARTFPSKR